MKHFSKLEYELINYTKCGPEELFVLIGAFAEEFGLDILLKTIVKLVNSGYLKYSHLTNKKSLQITLDQLNKYIQKRVETGEELDKVPKVWDEYEFEATKKGINILSNEDKPVKASHFR